MILDGEEDEAMGVLLQQWLVGFEIFDSGSDMRLFRLWLGSGFLRLGDALGDGIVLLVCNVEVEFLHRGIAHLQRLKGGSSLKNAYRVSLCHFDA